MVKYTEKPAFRYGTNVGYECHNATEIQKFGFGSLLFAFKQANFLAGHTFNCLTQKQGRIEQIYSNDQTCIPFASVRITMLFKFMKRHLLTIVSK